MGDMVEFRGGEIGKEDLASLVRLAADLLRKVADREIYRVRRLVLEQRHLCLV